MDFDKPLRKLEGFVIYTMIMDYMDTFIHEYTKQKGDKEFPSLRITTDMLLSLLNDLKTIEVSDLQDHEDIGQALEELELRLMKVRVDGIGSIFDSRKVGLFTDSINKEPLTNPKLNPEVVQKTTDEINKPLKIKTKVDRDWLRTCNISYKDVKTKLEEK